MRSLFVLALVSCLALAGVAPADPPKVGDVSFVPVLVDGKVILCRAVVVKVGEPIAAAGGKCPCGPCEYESCDCGPVVRRACGTQTPTPPEPAPLSIQPVGQPTGISDRPFPVPRFWGGGCPGGNCPAPRYRW